MKNAGSRIKWKRLGAWRGLALLVCTASAAASELLPSADAQAAHGDPPKESISLERRDQPEALPLEPREELKRFLRDRYKGTNVDVYDASVFVAVRIPEATYRVGQKKVPVGVKEKLAPVAEAIAKFQGQFDLLVEGHADSLGFKKRGAVDDNWEMGYLRAAGVADLLEKLNAPDASLGILTRGAGVSVSKGAADPRNRRVELLFAPKRVSARLAELKKALKPEVPASKRAQKTRAADPSATAAKAEARESAAPASKETLPSPAAEAAIEESLPRDQASGQRLPTAARATSKPIVEPNEIIIELPVIPLDGPGAVSQPGNQVAGGIPPRPSEVEIEVAN